MLSLLNAIYARFTADPSLTGAFPGGMHRDQAPEGTAMPYVVSRIVSAQSEFAFGGASRTIVQIRFSAFGVGHDATGALAELLASKFDGVLLTLATRTHDSLTRHADPAPILLRHDGQGNDVWEWSVVYEYGMI